VERVIERPCVGDGVAAFVVCYVESFVVCVGLLLFGFVLRSTSFDFAHEEHAEGLGLLFADGLGSGHIDAIGGLANFADRIADGERDPGKDAGGYLEAVEKQACPFVINGIGGQGGDDAGDGELNGGDVLNVRQVELVFAVEAGGGIFAVEFAGFVPSDGESAAVGSFGKKGVVVVAPEFTAKRDAAAFGPVDTDVMAFFHDDL
jgi:hypothetical protein